MNRRGFISAMLKAGVGCSILPAALTYSRVWKLPPKRHIWVIEWEDAWVGLKEDRTVIDAGYICTMKPETNYVNDIDGMFSRLLRSIKNGEIEKIA